MISCLGILVCFLLGSIPFGVIIGKLKGIDIREVGSGNIGAANAVRAFGWFGGILVLLGDIAKGSVCVYLAKYFTLSLEQLPLMQVLCGLAGIMGHNYSIFLKFKGGKGIATSLGVLMFLDWQAALVGFCCWIIIVVLTRLSALGSLTGALAVPVFMYCAHRPLEYLSFAVVACMAAFYKHRENIVRLTRGEENKISFKSRGTNNKD
jgi:acyl phosphate:glycerol-3-phosphate acyltransferase